MKQRVSGALFVLWAVLWGVLALVGLVVPLALLPQGAQEWFAQNPLALVGYWFAWLFGIVVTGDTIARKW